MIICGERLIIDKLDKNKSTWRNCILQKDHTYENHKFEGIEYTEMKRELILKLATKMNPQTPQWFSRQHNEFDQWSRDEKVTFGIRFLVHAALMNWSTLKKLAFLHNVSQDHYYVNDVMELNEKMNDMSLAMAKQAETDPLFKEQLEKAANEAQNMFSSHLNN